MNIDKAATNTLLLWEKTGKMPAEAERTTHGTSEAHTRFVLEAVEKKEIVGEKGHRWLGWAQGFLVARGILTLEDCKYSNVFS